MNERHRGGRVVTVLLLVLLAGVAGAAIFDSVRTAGGHEGQAPDRPTTVVRTSDVPHRAELATQLREQQVTGVLYFVDRRCNLHALGLPALTPSPAPLDGGCSALVSPAPAPPGWSLWPRNTPLAARCERDNVIVTPSAGPSLPMVGGCAPAWSPDGAMTFVRRGSIVQFPRVGRAELVLSRDELSRAIARTPVLRGSSGWNAYLVAWLGPSRLAVLAVAVPTRSVLVVLSGRRVVASRLRLPESVTGLRASPRGNYLALRTTEGTEVLDARTRNLAPVRRLGRPAAIAWSADERWRAVAGPGRVVFEGPGSQITLPLDAIDLAWTRSL